MFWIKLVSMKSNMNPICYEIFKLKFEILKISVSMEKHEFPDSFVTSRVLKKLRNLEKWVVYMSSMFLEIFIILW